MVRRKFRLSDMIPNAWFYKLRDMGAHGRGGVGVHHRSSSARSFQPPLSSARWSVEALRQPPSARWNREVSNDVQQPEADVEPPVTPTKESLRAPLPRRASYYYSTRDREVPAPPPRAKDAQSPTRSSRRRHKIDRAPEERGPVSAPARGKVPVVDASASSGRRRDMCIKGDGGEPRRPTVRGTADDGGNVKVIASQNEIIIDLRDEDTPGSRLRPIVTKPARRQPGPSEQDGSHVVDLANVSARAGSASEKSSVSRPRRSSASSSGRRRVKTLSRSPRLAATARKVNPPARKWTAPPPPLPAPVIVSSYPVVKMSEDPRQDFRESMEEMISAKGIQDAEDLEDLLACYLSLNDAAHHDLIIDVFEQIWVSLAGARP